MKTPNWIKSLFSKKIEIEAESQKELTTNIGEEEEPDIISEMSSNATKELKKIKEETKEILKQSLIDDLPLYIEYCSKLKTQTGIEHWYVSNKQSENVKIVKQIDNASMMLIQAEYVYVDFEYTFKSIRVFVDNHTEVEIDKNELKPIIINYIEAPNVGKKIQDKTRAADIMDKVLSSLGKSARRDRKINDILKG